MDRLLIDAGLSGPGTEASLSVASHIKRCRYMHKVFSATLYILLCDVYSNDVDCDNVEGRFPRIQIEVHTSNIG